MSRQSLAASVLPAGHSGCLDEYGLPKWEVCTWDAVYLKGVGRICPQPVGLYVDSDYLTISYNLKALVMWLVSLQLFWRQQWTNDQQIARGGNLFSLFDLATACTSSHHFQTSSHTLKSLFHRACPQWLCWCTMAPPGISWLVIMWFVDCSGAQRGHLEHSGSAWISSIEAICWPSILTPYCYLKHATCHCTSNFRRHQETTFKDVGAFPSTGILEGRSCGHLWPFAASFSRCPCDRRQLQWGTQSRPWISAAKDDGSSSLWEL